MRKKIHLGQHILIQQTGGTSRYDDAGTFKEAFRAARNEGDSDFLWKGERYSTELKPTVVSKPKGISPELLIRQAFRESTFNPKAISPAGYKGLGQIGDDVIADYKKQIILQVI